MENILFAADLSVSNEQALIRAIQLARYSSAKLNVIHVAPVRYISGATAEQEQRPEAAERKLAQFIEPHIGETRIKHAMYVERGGRVYEHIVEYAKALGADLTVIGGDGGARLNTTAGLSTTERIVLRTYSPVLVVSKLATGFYENIRVVVERGEQFRNIVEPAISLGPHTHFQIFRRSTIKSGANDLISRFRLKVGDWRFNKLVAYAENVAGMRDLPGHKVSARVLEYADIVSDEFIDTIGTADAISLPSVATNAFHPQLPNEVHALLKARPCDILFRGHR
ncbi:MAG: universal stress protein [Gammaproteobacteria bacterium]